MPISRRPAKTPASCSSDLRPPPFAPWARRRRPGKLAIAGGAPVVPGIDHEITLDEAREFGRQHGYPVLLKAVAGGGGKGMRARGARKRSGIGAARRCQRGRPVVPQSRHLRGEAGRAAAPHRNPALRRPARQHGAPGRARMLHPAEAPEGDRGVPFPADRAASGDAPGDGRSGHPRRARGRTTTTPARWSFWWTATGASTFWR